MTFCFLLLRLRSGMTGDPLFHVNSGRPSRQHFVVRHKEHPKIVPVVGTLNIVGGRHHQMEFAEHECRLSTPILELDVRERNPLQSPRGSLYYSAVGVRIHKRAIPSKQLPIGQVNPEVPFPMYVMIRSYPRAELEREKATYTKLDPPRRSPAHRVEILSGIDGRSLHVYSIQT